MEKFPKVFHSGKIYKDLTRWDKTSRLVLLIIDDTLKNIPGLILKIYYGVY